MRRGQQFGGTAHMVNPPVPTSSRGRRTTTQRAILLDPAERADVRAQPGDLLDDLLDHERGQSKRRSSSNSNRGFAIKARAIAVICCSPPAHRLARWRRRSRSFWNSEHMPFALQLLVIGRSTVRRPPIKRFLLHDIVPNS